jgi:hypothetical protein
MTDRSESLQRAPRSEPGSPDDRFYMRVVVNSEASVGFTVKNWR